MRSRVRSRAVLVCLGTLFLVATVYLAVLAFGGERLLKTNPTPGGAIVQSHDPRPWIVLMLLCGLGALAGWLLADRRAEALAGRASEADEAQRTANERAEQLSQAHEELAQARSKSDELRHELDSARRSRADEHTLRTRLERGWRSEREWNRELRDQVLRMHREHGMLGRFDDVHAMVLRLTMSLTGAEKGLLMSRVEGSVSEDMQVDSAEGFENDPRDSAIAQRFAREVIERDTTIRQDDVPRLDHAERGPADEEVSNLLAIPIYLQDDFHGVVICANREGGFGELQDDVLLAVGDHAGAVLENSRLHGDLRNAYLATVRMLADAIEVKDPQLRGHSDLVSDYVMAVADRLGFEPRQREELIFGSLLHDVGKLGISERILLKPGPLTDEERGVIQLHPRIGYHLVRQVPALHHIAPAVLHHHERFDGDGYPARLCGEEIPMAARIIAVADAFSAMTVDRPYSQAKSVEEACSELERCAGGQFDPQVVSLFVAEVRRRPADCSEPVSPPADPELETRRQEGEFVLGARSFGITDSLTLLYSRRHLHETAQACAQRSALQEGRSFALVIAELSDLPEINEQRGYGAGDDALQHVGGAFQSAAADCRGTAFRASGCRLALLCDDIGADQAARLAEELAREVASVSQVRTASAVWQPGESGSELIARARMLLREPSAPIAA